MTDQIRDVAVDAALELSAHHKYLLNVADEALQVGVHCPVRVLTSAVVESAHAISIVSKS